MDHGAPPSRPQDNRLRSIYQHVSMVAVDPQGAACAALTHAVLHAMGANTMGRSPVLPPVLTRDKLLYIARRAG